MENIRDLEAQARNLERSGQHAAALELYGRMVEEPDGDRAGGIWARIAGLQLAIGRDADAADSYAAAAERYQAEGLANLALSYCQRSLRTDESRPEMLLRFGELSAQQGYPRDARHGYVEYAERAVAVGDVDAAADALRAYLAAFPSDAAVRRRLSELTGEPESAPPAAPEPSRLPGTETLPGLVTTAHEADEATVEDVVGATSAGGMEEAGQAEGGLTGVAPLEGFEPTHADEAYAAASGPEEGVERESRQEASAEERAHDAWGAPPPREGHGPPAGQAREAPEPEEEADAEPLPLLGLEDEDEQDRGDAAAGSEPLPLLDFEEPISAPAAAEPSATDAVSRARRRVAVEPESLSAWRDLVSLLREQGDPSVEQALTSAEEYFADRGRTAEALEFAVQLARLHPDDTAMQQRRVERALRAGNRPALVEAYLALAARFEADLDTRRAQETLTRVLELDPANEDARAALASVTAAASPPRDYVDLGELILAGTPEEATRFQVAIGDPTGDEESDFAEILDLFRKKVSESLDPKDAASHYDLGLAFKEMGLLDDAIVHLQSGLRGGANPLATLEVLGECFVLKGQLSLASRVFDRATRLEGVADTDLVGVLYGLARSQEQLGQREEARATYERVVAVDLSFRDAAGRLQLLQSG